MTDGGGGGGGRDNDQGRIQGANPAMAPISFAMDFGPLQRRKKFF